MSNKNRAGVATTTTGTGTITLGTAISASTPINAAAWQTFAAAGVVNGEVVRYLILDSSGWEYGPGTYTSVGTTLSRPATAMDGTVAGQKSSTNALLNLSGAAQVFITATVEDFVPFDTPTFTGDPKAPTPASTDNDTSIATTAFVRSAAVYKPGDTMTGQLTFTVSAGLSISIAPTAAILAASRFAYLTGQGALTDVWNSTSAGYRWKWWWGTGNETGSNAGSNFALQNFDDTGTQIGTPLTITRSTGVFALGSTPTFPTVATADNSTNGATTAYVKSNLSNYLPLTGGTLTGALAITVAAGIQFNISPPSGLSLSRQGYVSGQGAVKEIIQNTAGQPRWKWWYASGAESGSNAGSDFSIQNFDDTGANLGTPFVITRSTGRAQFNNGLQFGNQTASSTTDLSKHLALFGTNWGFGVTSGQINVLASGTLTATITTAGFQLLQTPTAPTPAANDNSTKIATTAYVDAADALDTSKPTARLATTAALPANTYANGTAGVGATLTATANAALTVDGVAVATNDLVLVKNEATAANNGLYTVTNTGSGSAAYVLTRSIFMNSAAEFSGAVVTVLAGTLNAYSTWLCNPTTPVTVGTTAIPFSLASAGVSGTPITGQFARWADAEHVQGVAAPLSEAGGRLTLTSGTPVLTATVSAATTVYYTPYQHQLVPLYDGTNFLMTDIGGELSQLLSDTTKSPAAAIAASTYDYFVWNDAGTIRCTRGPLWSSGTSRGTGAGTTELIRVKGILLNANAITNGPAAQRGTYVGSIQTDGGTGTVSFVFGGVSAGGTAIVFNLWNMYNRRNFGGVCVDNTSGGHTYANAVNRGWNNQTQMRASFVNGLAEDAVTAIFTARTLLAAAGAVYLFFGENSSTVAAANSGTGVGGPAASTTATVNYTNTLIGFNFVQVIERGDGTNTATLSGTTPNPLNALTFNWFG